MPLTIMLRDSTHPVAQWMKQYWSRWPDGWQDWKQTIDAADPPVRPPKSGPYPWGLVDHAWQFGFELRWGTTSLNETTAGYGVSAWTG